MMTFKEWLLSEDSRTPHFHQPQTLKVWVQGRPVVVPAVTIIDMRFEDWNLEWLLKKQAAEQKRQTYTIGKPGIIGMTPPPVRPPDSVPPRESFSAPLADGRFINFQAGNWMNQSTEIGAAEFPPVRKDWADFAEFVSENSVVKAAKYDREERMRLLDTLVG